LVGADVSWLRLAMLPPPPIPFACTHGITLASQNTTPLEYLTTVGNWSTVRLRLFVDPPPSLPNDVDYTLAAAAEAKAVGADVVLALHYSDRWADPGTQDVPRRWQEAADAAAAAATAAGAPRAEVRQTLVASIADSVGNYTRAVVDAFVDAGIRLAGVQVGNEVRNGLLWPTGRLVKMPRRRCEGVNGGAANDDPAQPSYQEAWPGGKEAFDANAAYLLAGARGVRVSKAPSTPVILHLDRGDCVPVAQAALRPLAARGVVDAVDILGFSFHPKFHTGRLQNLDYTLNAVARDYKKDVVLMEVAFPFAGAQWEPESDEWDWPVTPEGQAQFTRDVARVVRNIEANQTVAKGGSGAKGLGYYWWHPELVAGYSLGDVWEGGRYSFFHRNGTALPAAPAMGDVNVAPRGRTCTCGRPLPSNV